MQETFSVERVDDSLRDTYNQAVQRAPQADFLQSFEWGEIKRHTGWSPLRFLVRDGAGRYRAAATLLEKRLPGVIKRFLYAPRGPALDYEDAPLLDFVMGFMAELARERRAMFVKIDPDVPKPRPDLVERLQQHQFVPARFRPHWGGVQPVAVCRLPLEGTEDDILSRFRRKTRYNIRLAERRGVRVREGGRQDVPTFHAIWQETAHRQNFGVRGLDHLYMLWDHMIAKGYGTLLLAEWEDEALAGVIITFFGPRTWYLYGGTRNEHRDRMPMYLLQWEAIRRAKARGSTLYDFLGVSCHMDPQDPLYGLYRFKRGFNPEYTEFIGEYDLPVEPVSYRIWNRFEPAYLRTMRQVDRARRLAGSVLDGAARGGLGPL